MDLLPPYERKDKKIPSNMEGILIYETLVYKNYDCLVQKSVP
jgi:hypothetical protein